MSNEKKQYIGYGFEQTGCVRDCGEFDSVEEAMRAVENAGLDLAEVESVWRRQPSDKSNITKHTPGPWRTGGKERRCIFAENGDVVARIAAYGEQSETPEADKANARLIAAAPELLATLIELTERVERIVLPDQSTPCTIKARAAIAKATGEQP